jgi:hypothetical protein
VLINAVGSAAGGRIDQARSSFGNAAETDSPLVE